MVHMSHHPYKILGTLIDMSAIHIFEFVQKIKYLLTKDSYVYMKNLCCSRKKREGVMWLVKIKKIYHSVTSIYLISYVRYSKKSSNFSRFAITELCLKVGNIKSN
ncbi:hypothetical protein COE15_12980 [Bacillus cereus]|nr:hypothetical protein COE15_12980 [Bacillus cereus]